MGGWRWLGKWSVFFLCIAAAAVVHAVPPDAHWVGTWAAAPDAPGPALKAQTVRQVIRTSVGGSGLRIRLSNLYGDGPVTMGPVHVALQADGSSLQPGSDHALTFDGKSTITLAKGDSALSDAISTSVAPLQKLAISLYVADMSGPSTIHAAGMATAYIVDGDATARRALGPSEVNDSRFFVTDVEVATAPVARAVVTFGDSITDGTNSTPDANKRWPDVLAARLQADPKFASIGVVNAGISGNRILNDGAGMSALKRFDRDALSKPNVHWIILLEGINDIGWAGQATAPQEVVSAQQIIDGMKTLVSRAHAKGIKIYAATLTPFGGMQWPYHSAAGEQKREAVNAWIRHSSMFDAVIDFDKVTRDPAHPDRFLPAYDSGDHLHPSDAGYQAMANAIDLRLFASGQ
jgi:lysophospholipase L1-like esterase